MKVRKSNTISAATRDALYVMAQRHACEGLSYRQTIHSAAGLVGKVPTELSDDVLALFGGIIRSAVADLVGR